MSEVDILLGSAIAAGAVFTLAASRRPDGLPPAAPWARRVMTLGLLAVLISGMLRMVDGIGYDMPNIPVLDFLFFAGTATFVWMTLRRRRGKGHGR